MTDLRYFDEAKRLLREWAVANDLFYGGGYLYFENENLYRLFWEARREREAENSSNQTHGSLRLGLVVRVNVMVPADAMAPAIKGSIAGEA